MGAQRRMPSVTVSLAFLRSPCACPPAAHRHAVRQNRPLRARLPRGCRHLPAPHSSPQPADATTAGAARARRDAEWAGLLERAAGGDAAAFERFYDDSFALASALARRIVGDADSEDILAEAYFQAWRESSRFDPARSSAATWLLLIVRSRAIDCVRRRWPQATEDERDAALASLPEPAPGPAEAAEQREQTLRLHAALALLTDQERCVVALAFFRDLTHGAISQATGLPLGTVKSLAARGQRKLRETMSRTR